MTTIAIDIRMWKNSGIGTYLQNLVPPLIKRNPNCKFILYGDKNNLNDDKRINQNKNITLIDFTAPIYSIEEQIYFYKNINKKISIFWSPHYNSPLLNHKLNKIVTLHDVYHLYNFKNLSFKQKMYAYIMIKLTVKNANKILTVSHFSKNEIMKYCSVSTNKIKIIKNSINHDTFKKIKDIASLKNTKKKFGIPENFILFVGNVKPNKNLINLLKAINKIENINLVIAGKIDNFISNDYNNISSYLVNNKKVKNRVFFTGYVTNNEISHLYNLASLFVFPTLYEGFGIPPLEAMGCGCPTAVSRIPSLKETCGDATIYFDPNNIKELRSKISKILHNEKLKEKMVRKGFEQVKKFSWERSVENLDKLIHKLL